MRLSVLAPTSDLLSLARARESRQREARPRRARPVKQLRIVRPPLPRHRLRARADAASCLISAAPASMPAHPAAVTGSSAGAHGDPVFLASPCLRQSIKLIGWSEMLQAIVGLFVMVGRYMGNLVARRFPQLFEEDTEMSIVVDCCWLVFGNYYSGCRCLGCDLGLDSSFQENDGIVFWFCAKRNFDLTARLTSRASGDCG